MAIEKIICFYFKPITTSITIHIGKINQGNNNEVN